MQLKLQRGNHPRGAEAKSLLKMGYFYSFKLTCSTWNHLAFLELLLKVDD